MVNEVANAPNVVKTANSVADLLSVDGTEYMTIPGFAPGQQLEIGSLTAGDILEWVEANDGEAKKTAGLRLICKSLVSTAETGRVRYAADPKNIDVFRKMPHRACEEVIAKILELNKMTPKKEAETKKD